MTTEEGVVTKKKVGSLIKKGTGRGRAKEKRVTGKKKKKKRDKT